ncbi:hypothetical protein HDU93_005766, partial [Gonapodya sp. JEL0774]
VTDDTLRLYCDSMTIPVIASFLKTSISRCSPKQKAFQSFCLRFRQSELPVPVLDGLTLSVKDSDGFQFNLGSNNQDIYLYWGLYSINVDELPPVLGRTLPYSRMSKVAAVNYVWREAKADLDMRKRLDEKLRMTHKFLESSPNSSQDTSSSELARQVKELEGRVGRRDRTIQELEKQLTHSSSRGKDETIALLRRNLADKEEEIQNLKASTNSLTKDALVADLINQIQDLTDNLCQIGSHDKDMLVSQEKMIASLRDQVLHNANQCNTLREQHKEDIAMISRSKEEIIARLHQDLASKDREILKLRNTINQYPNFEQVEEVFRQNHTLRTELQAKSRIEDNTQQLRQQIADLQSQLQHASDTCNSLREEVAERERGVQHLFSQFQSMAAQRDAQIANLEALLEAAKSRSNTFDVTTLRIPQSQFDVISPPSTPISLEKQPELLRQPRQLSPSPVPEPTFIPNTQPDTDCESASDDDGSASSVSTVVTPVRLKRQAKTKAERALVALATSSARTAQNGAVVEKGKGIPKARRVRNKAPKEVVSEVLSVVPESQGEVGTGPIRRVGNRKRTFDGKSYEGM